MPKRNEKNGRVTLSPLLQHSKTSNAEVDRLIGLVKGKIEQFFHFLLMHNEIPAPDLLALLSTLILPCIIEPHRRHIVITGLLV